MRILIAAAIVRIVRYTYASRASVQSDIISGNIARTDGLPDDARLTVCYKDFGDIEPTDDTRAEFALIETQNVDYFINSIRTDCGRTTAKSTGSVDTLEEIWQRRFWDKAIDAETELSKGVGPPKREKASLVESWIP